MANFQQFQGDLTAAFNVANTSQALIAQQKATSAEMLAQVERFNQTRMMMDEARAKVGSIMSAYQTDDKGKPDPSAPKYVHDAYNAVNKEGGLQQMSASQLNAVLTGYQTGVQASQQRLQDMQVQRAIRQEEEQTRIEDAWRKTQEEREKISKEETVTEKKTKVSTKAIDLNSTTGLIDLLATSSKPEAPGKGVKKSPDKVIDQNAAWGGKTLVQVVQDAAKKAEEQEARKREEVAARAVEEARIAELPARRARIVSEIESADASLNSAKQAFENPNTFNTSTGTYGAGMPGAYSVKIEGKRKTEAQTKEEYAQIERTIREANKRKTDALNALDAIDNEIATGPRPLNSIPPIGVRKSGSNARNVYVTEATYEDVQTKQLKSQEALLNDEYNIITNQLKATGSLPSSWSRSTFMQMKGFPNIQQVEIPGVGMYVSVNGKGEVIKNKDLVGDLGDQTKVRDAVILAQQRSLNGTELAAGSGYRFTGEIRSNDIKDVNKVRMEVATTSTALTNVDTLLRIAEDSSLLDKMVPGEITGIASSISNAIQAASRTEIGGSGAWSEQDQVRIDKIVRDPTSIRNAAFRQETIASIKAYKQRLLDSVNRSGSVYGFRLSGTPSDARNAEAKISRARIAYQTALSSGKSEQEARQVARDAYGMSL
jgi:hypothetical protein